MLKIRLQRIGRKNEVAFRMVLTESKNAAQSGKFKEILGYYTIKDNKIDLKEDRVKYWLENGVQVSDTALNILIDKGLKDGRKKNVLPKKSPTSKKKDGQKK